MTNTFQNPPANEASFSCLLIPNSPRRVPKHQESLNLEAEGARRKNVTCSLRTEFSVGILGSIQGPQLYFMQCLFKGITH